MEFTMIKQILTSTLAVATISFATVTNANQAVEINETHPEPGTVEYTPARNMIFQRKMTASG
jgi:hypothetical protein